MRRVVPPLAIVASLIFTLAVYSRLPAMVPIHWGIHGRPDAWAPREVGAFLVPGIAVLVYVVLLLVMRHSWRGAGDAPYIRASETIVAVIITFLSLTQVVMLGSALGWRINVVQAIVLGIGVMLIIVGFQMVEMPRNPWFGIRTPWTLRSDRVWKQTHRVGARIMVICGVALGFSTLLAPQWTIGVVLLSALLLLVTTVGYSYYVSRTAGE